MTDKIVAIKPLHLVSAASAGEGRDVSQIWLGRHGRQAGRRRSQILVAHGRNRVVDELIVSFTHDREMKVYLPGVAMVWTGERRRPVTRRTPRTGVLRCANSGEAFRRACALPSHDSDIDATRLAFDRAGYSPDL